MRSACDSAVSEERLGYSERHADKAPRGQVPGHLVSTPPFVSPLCPAVGHNAKRRVRVWCSLPMLGSRAPRQRYTIPVYMSYIGICRYISVHSVAALRGLCFLICSFIACSSRCALAMIQGVALSASPSIGSVRGRDNETASLIKDFKCFIIDTLRYTYT